MNTSLIPYSRFALPAYSLREDEGRRRLVATFDVLAHDMRLHLIEILASSPTYSVDRLAALFEMGQTAISYHLRLLSEAGLIRCKRVGREHYYYAEASRLKAIQEVFDPLIAQASKIDPFEI